MSDDHVTPAARPEHLEGYTIKKRTGCGTLFITVNVNNGKVFEVFTTIGKAGGCAASQAEALGRMISIALRSSVEPLAIVEQLKGIRCHSPMISDGVEILSCADAVAQALSDAIKVIK